MVLTDYAFFCVLHFGRQINDNTKTCHMGIVVNTGMFDSVSFNHEKSLPMINKKKSILSVTEAAEKRINELVVNRNKPTAGIRIAIRTKGCSGLSYTIEYADEIKQGDEKIELQDTSIFIDPKAVLFIIGSEMDYADEVLQKGFVFKNPNEKGRCGCGQSFTV